MPLVAGAVAAVAAPAPACGRGHRESLSGGRPACRPASRIQRRCAAAPCCSGPRTAESAGAHPPASTACRAGCTRFSAICASARFCRWPRPPTTAHGNDGGISFQVIHPHHPLRDQRFRLVTYRHNWGEDRVYFHDSGGRLCSIPACWTTAVAADPFVTLAAGRCLFRYEDLLKLADLLEKAR